MVVAVIVRSLYHVVKTGCKAATGRFTGDVLYFKKNIAGRPS